MKDSKLALLGALAALLAAPASAQEPGIDTETDEADELVLTAPEPVPIERPDLSAALRGARALDAHTDYERAAGAYEAYTRTCLAEPTALLAEGEPCAPAGRTLQRAMDLRQALGHRERAARDAELYVAHFLYARPREAIRVRFTVARMYLEAGELTRATEAIEGLAGTHPDAPEGLSLVVEALRARVAHARGNTEQAERHWRRVERDFAGEALRDDGAVPTGWVREAVAEGRLLRAEHAVERYLAVRAPRAQGGDRARWWSRVLTPWLVRSRRRLAVARAALERVYEMGSPRHSVIAAARIGEMYEHQADLHAALDIRDDALNLIVNPEPGVDQARAHLETCVRWASHHGVARDWASRCEQRLHALDPVAYPQQAELFRQSPFLPVAHAPPPPEDRDDAFTLR